MPFALNGYQRGPAVPATDAQSLTPDSRPGPTSGWSLAVEIAVVRHEWSVLDKITSESRVRKVRKTAAPPAVVGGCAICLGAEANRRTGGVVAECALANPTTNRQIVLALPVLERPSCTVLVRCSQLISLPPRKVASCRKEL
jgi:hypothetical protein